MEAVLCHSSIILFQFHDKKGESTSNIWNNCILKFYFPADNGLIVFKKHITMLNRIITLKFIKKWIEKKKKIKIKKLHWNCKQTFHFLRPGLRTSCGSLADTSTSSTEPPHFRRIWRTWNIMVDEKNNAGWKSTKRGCMYI